MRFDNLFLFLPPLSKWEHTAASPVHVSEWAWTSLKDIESHRLLFTTKSFDYLIWSNIKIPGNWTVDVLNIDRAVIAFARSEVWAVWAIIPKSPKSLFWRFWSRILKLGSKSIWAIIRVHTYGLSGVSFKVLIFHEALGFHVFHKERLKEQNKTFRKWWKKWFRFGVFVINLAF